MSGRSLKNPPTVLTHQGKETTTSNVFQSGLVEFYSRAFIISENFIQQQEHLLHPQSSNIIGESTSHGPQNKTSRGMTMPSEKRIFIEAFGLSLSGDSGASAVTATALRESEKTTDQESVRKMYTLYIAKNGGFDNEDHKVISRIKDWLNESNASDYFELDDTLCDTIVSHASRRIRRYFNKGKRKKLINFRKLLKQKGRISTNAAGGLQEFFDDLYHCLGQITRTNNPNSSLLKVLKKCHNFTQTHEFSIGLLRVFWERYDRADSMRSPWLLVITTIAKLAKFSRAFNCLSEFRRSLNLEGAAFEVDVVNKQLEVRFPDVTDIKTYLAELSNNPSYSHIQERLKAGQDSIKCGTVYTHCEIKLLDHIFDLLDSGKIKIEDMYDFIGCSKRPCFLCAGMINLGTDFKVADPHWKLYWRWGVPERLREKENLRNAITSLLHRMDLILRDEKYRPTKVDEGKSLPKEGKCNNWVWNPQRVTESLTFANSGVGLFRKLDSRDPHFEKLEHNLDEIDLLYRRRGFKLAVRN
ncbi:hypothetical protein AAE478_002102 [Parahypoxylon ruwenzoriense]